jgi:phosphatidylserine/phosphatidylglycerophosphate/cardiolipin synthase-like enzyme
MRQFSKASLLPLALALLVTASCNSDFNSNPQQLVPVQPEIVNEQEVTSFASAATDQILYEQDTNRDNQINQMEAAASNQDMAQIDQDRDGNITKAEIADNIQNEFYNAVRVTRALAEGPDDSVPGASIATRSFTKLPPSTFKGNKVQLFVDREEILPMMLEEIRGAKTSIQMDVYLLGGKIGVQVAQELVKKAKEGVDVKITMDPSLGFAGPTQKEIYQVTEYFRQSGLVFKLYPLHLMPLVQDGPLKNKFQIDHDKLYVIDGSTFIVGGFNLFDLGVDNRDIMLKIEGPTASEASDLMGYEWTMGDNYIAPKAPKNVFIVKDAPGDSMVKIVKTAPFESSTKTAIIDMINNAHKNVFLAVLEYSDMDVTAALIKAFKRGVDVRVLMDRKDTNDKYAGGIPVPTNFPNILPARELVKNNVPTKWYDARFKGQELHMKMVVADGEQLIAGSTNFTRQAFTTFRETSVVVTGGTAPVKMEKTFTEDWVSHSTYIKKLSLRDKIKAKVVEFLDKKYYAWW